MNLLLTLTLYLSQFTCPNPPASTAYKVPAKPTEGVKATKKRFCWYEQVGKLQCNVKHGSADTYIVPTNSTLAGPLDPYEASPY